jgi:hypothetical protein
MITCGIVFFVCICIKISQSFTLIISGADWKERWKNEFWITCENYVGFLSPLSNVYKICPKSSQGLFAFGCFPWFVLNVLCVCDDVLFTFWWKKQYAVLMQFCFFNFQPKTIPFCKKIIMTFSKQHTSCIWTAQYFSSIVHQNFQNNIIKMTKK